MLEENISLFALLTRDYDPGATLERNSQKECVMKRLDARQQLGALMAAMGITFSIVWVLSSYAYAAPPSAGLSPTADRVVRVQACS
jgi:hypothetical protein